MSRRQPVVLVISLFLILPSLALAQESVEGTKQSADGERADREWAQRTSKLNIQQQKIKEATDKLQKLITAKNAGREVRDEKNNKVDVLAEIATTHGLLKTHVEDYNKAKNELRYRYPEEGALIERRYVPMRLQTLEQIEREIGIEGRLDRLKVKSDKKYEPFIGKKPEEVAPAEPQPKPTLKERSQSEEEKNKKRLKLVQ